MGLKQLRIANFRKLFDVLVALKPNGGMLLDVGAAHGWFLDVAQKKFNVIGIEPDEAIYAAAVARGSPLRNGYFPEALAPDERVDVIVFNDVIEHIPDIDGVLTACRQHLHEGGILLVNLPSSGGAFYRIAKALSRLGSPGFLDRLWQVRLPSPHVHYFNSANLTRLLRKHGFTPMRSGRLESLGYSGLWTRISYTGQYSWPMKVLLFTGTSLVIPFLALLPSDIVYVVVKSGQGSTPS